MNTAHFTFSEYLDIVNPDSESHPDTAYEGYTAKNIDYETKLEKYPILNRQFLRKGVLFEIRTEVIDRWEQSYVKKDSEGEVIMDDKGQVVCLNMEEKEKLISDRYNYEHAVFDVRNNLIVANTQDEWGCLLIMSDKKYRGFGLGHEVLTENIKVYPDRYSGGTTNAGHNCLYRAHQKIVREHLITGGFRSDYLDGKLSMDKIKSILDSVDVVGSLREIKKTDLIKHNASEAFIRDSINPPFKDKSNITLDFSNSNNWLLHTKDNWAVLYDKNIFPIMHDSAENKFGDFVEDAIIGYVYLGGVYGEKSIPKLFSLHGRTDKIKAFMTEAVLNQNISKPIRVFKKDVKMLKSELGHKVTFTDIKNSSLTQMVMSEPTIDNLRDMNFIEKCIRLKHDKFDEKWMLIQEMSTQLGQEHNKDDIKSEFCC